jgi:hypothetical protein
VRVFTRQCADFKLYSEGESASAINNNSESAKTSHEFKEIISAYQDPDSNLEVCNVRGAPPSEKAEGDTVQ